MMSLRDAGSIMVTSVHCSGSSGCGCRTIVVEGRGDDHRGAVNLILFANTSATTQENPSGGRAIVASEPR